MADYPREGWHAFLKRLRIEQGEHTLIIGPTSSGKTRLALDVLESQRDGYVLGLFVKGRDDTADEWRRHGWQRWEEWPRKGLRKGDDRVMLWPRIRKTQEDTTQELRTAFRDALDWANYTGKVGVYVDETSYLIDLGMSTRLNQLFYLARSNKISATATLQRPKFVPRVLMSNSSHAFIARTTDPDDVKRLSDLGGVDRKELQSNLERLDNRHDFVYVNPLGAARPAIVNTRSG